jgi:hypothetical protein
LANIERKSAQWRRRPHNFVTPRDAIFQSEEIKMLEIKPASNQTLFF